MAKFEKREIPWEEFYEGFIDGGYYEFEYKNLNVNVGVETTKRFFHKEEKEWYFVVLDDADSGRLIISAKYQTAQLLLENARVEGRSLREIWDELELLG